MLPTPSTAAARILDSSAPNPLSADPLLTTEQTAERLAIAPKTLDTWRSTNRQRLPFVKIGGRVRYRLSDVEAFIAARVRCAEEA